MKQGCSLLIHLASSSSTATVAVTEKGDVRAEVKGCDTVFQLVEIGSFFLMGVTGDPSVHGDELEKVLMAL